MPDLVVALVGFLLPLGLFAFFAYAAWIVIRNGRRSPTTVQPDLTTRLAYLEHARAVGAISESEYSEQRRRIIESA